MRILVVEDDASLNAQLKSALEDAGYVVDAATDGEDGHFLGDTEPYDLVVLDIGLPQMDGIQILKRWRADGRIMPVLILTARDRWSDKVSGIDAGADDYVTKPFHVEEVLARVPGVTPLMVIRGEETFMAPLRPNPRTQFIRGGDTVSSCDR